MDLMRQLKDLFIHFEQALDKLALKLDRPIVRIPVLAFYLSATAYLVLHHSMFWDEMQAWDLARDAHSIPELLGFLRYEGHPALWYLILYLPSHLGWPPQSLAWINWILSALEAFLLLFVARVSILTRLGFLFSFFLFYDYPVIARNYMLAVLLLTAAILCYTADKSKPKWAVFFLCLAAQSHFFALVIAGLVFAYSEGLFENWRGLKSRILNLRFLVSSLLLLLSVAAVYYTLHPAADSHPTYKVAGHSIVETFLRAEGKFWQALFPVPGNMFGSKLAAKLVPIYTVLPVASLLSAIVIALIIYFVPRSSSGRIFLTACIVGLLSVFSFTVGAGYLWHYGMIFICLPFTLMLESKRIPATTQPASFNSALRVAVLFLFALPQVAAGVASSARASYQPYNHTLEASHWLQQQGLVSNPMLFENDDYRTLLSGYLNFNNAYSPACACFRSFMRADEKRVDNKPASDAEVAMVAETSRLPLLIITSDEIAPNRAAHLHLILIKKYTQTCISHIDLYIYQQSSPL